VLTLFILERWPPHERQWPENARTSDAYLTQIARENGMQLATFDTGIADAVAEPIGRAQR